MKFVRIAWRVLVGIKDALVLALLLVFFGGLFTLLNARPKLPSTRDGALVIDMAGAVVEQPQTAQLMPFGDNATPREIRLRDLVRALVAAKSDAHVKAIVIDLDGFEGGYPAAMTEIGNAVRAARTAGKPVLAYATAYTDSGYRIASNASEIWMNPMGGTLFTGPGGNQLYYKGLIDKLGVNVHVYRVGKFKSFVEPYTRADQSPEAREASQALYSALAEDWRTQVAKARPKAQVDAFLARPGALVTAENGDVAQANLKAGIVDKLGDPIAFDKRVVELAGQVAGKAIGTFNTIKYADYVKAHPLPTGGDAIGVLTVAGDIVDGTSGPGTAAGDTLSKAMLNGLAKKNLKALVVRIDSPGGSALASETIRQAILQAKAKGLPVVVSMGSVAASGGYWVATSGDVIFAEPDTITGSIGIFGIIPTFENALKKIGVTTDGVKTTPLSGQPDLFGGTTPEIDAILQSGIENGYREFITRVATARRMTPARVNDIGQGRVWIGGTAHQLGLVDRFGTIDDAIAEAARRAKLDPDKVHAEYLEKKPGAFGAFVAGLLQKDDDDDDTSSGASSRVGGDAFARVATMQRATLARAIGDMRRLATTGSIQARCLECAAFAPAHAEPGDQKLLALLMARVGL